MQPVTEPEYGIVGAGHVSASLVGQLPRNPRALGPVAAVSFRVASRIANTLGAGWAARSLDDLNAVRLILFYAPPEHFSVLAEALAEAGIQWAGKSLIFCDCGAAAAAIQRFRNMGASVARLRRCGLPGRLVVEGSAPSLTMANRLVRELKAKPVVIAEGSEVRFDAALTLASAGVTPLIDGVARLLRQCGVRDADAVQLAAGLFSGTAAGYAHSGRQSWLWHIQEPVAEELLAQTEALGEPIRALFRQLLALGFGTFERHPEVARILAGSGLG